LSKFSLFFGAATALITPFEQNGALDLGSYRKLLRFQLDEGIDALLVCGTTGETPTLSDDECLTLLCETVKTAQKSVPIIMGVGSNCTEHAVEKARTAEQNGADALLAVTIPENVCYIGAECFTWNDKMTSVTFEGDCPVFGPGCFENNDQAITIKVPDDQLEAYQAALPHMNVVPSGQNSLTEENVTNAANFTVDGNVIVSYNKWETRVDVPAEVNGTAITAIGDGAFPKSHYVSYVTLPEGVEMAMPGDHVTVNAELLYGIAMEEGLRFAIREGGRTVGDGRVATIED